MAAMSQLPKVGPWAISAPCAPQNVCPDFGFVLTCGGTLANTSNRPQELTAELFQPDGGTAAVQAPYGPVRGLVQPSGLITLQTPPTGWSWACAWVSKRTAAEWALAGIGVVTVIGSLAGVGLVDIIRHLRKRKKRR